MTRLDQLSCLGVHLAAVPMLESIGCGPSRPVAWESLALHCAKWLRPEDLSPVRVLSAQFHDAIDHDHAVLIADVGPTVALIESPAPASDPTVYDDALAEPIPALEIGDVAGWTLAATEAPLAALVELFGISD